MKKSLFYLTFNGVFNNTNGVGRQTKTLLQGIEFYYNKLIQEFGDFALNIVVPIYSEHTWGYDKTDIEYAEKVVKSTGGNIYYVPYCVDPSDFWTVANWQSISYTAAATVLQQASNYSESLTIAVDPPYLHAPLVIANSSADFGVKVKSLISLFSSTYILEQDHLSADKLDWEATGIASAKDSQNIRLANICNSFTDHLQTNYAADPQTFTPYASSLFLESADFVPYSEAKVIEIMDKYHIPKDKKIILAFGRGDYVKGFDILLNNVGAVKDYTHIVMIVPSYSNTDPIFEEYRSLISKNHIENITLVTEYTRELPKALSQWQNTAVAVCPSRGDTFPNVPLEVALWAKDSGPICVTSNANGLDEQIIDGVNGYKFDIDSPESLSDVLDRAVNLPDSERAEMRRAAYAKVVKERDFYSNFREMLSYFWKS